MIDEIFYTKSDKVYKLIDKINKINMKIIATCETDYKLSKQTINVHVLLDPVYTFKENIIIKKS